MQSYFYDLADYLADFLSAGQEYSANFYAEATDFVPFQGGVIQRPGRRTSQRITIDVSEGRRHAVTGFTLFGQMKRDRFRLRDALSPILDLLSALDDDPFFEAPGPHPSSERRGPDPGPDLESLSSTLEEAIHGTEAFGQFTAGPIYRGFANSPGQRNWFSANPLRLEVSFRAPGGSHARGFYAGEEWDREQFLSPVIRARERLEVLSRPLRELPPGDHPALLAPSAFASLWREISAEGFSFQKRRIGCSPLLRMGTDGRGFHPALTVSDHCGGNVCPSFGPRGLPRPERIVLIENGRGREQLVNERSALEFHASQNGADAEEIPVALEIEPGKIAESEAIPLIDRGLYLGDLSALAFPEPGQGALAGVSAGALWIENGKPVAPLPPLRIHDDLPRILGKNLWDLTRERELFAVSEAEGERSTRSVRVPGALLRELRLAPSSRRPT